METLVNVVFFVVNIVMFIGWVLMLIAGFKRSVWWGLGIFFLVIPVGIIFAIKYWEDARLGCLLQLIGGLIMVGLLVAFWSVVSAIMFAGMGEEMARLQQQQQGLGAAGGGGTIQIESGGGSSAGGSDAGSTQAAAPAPAPPPAPSRPQYAWQDTDFDFLPSNLGARVKIQTTDGRTHEGKVIAVSGDTVKLLKRVGTGSIEFGVRKRDAKVVQIFEVVQ